jgi:hypothetical protein
MCIITYLVKLVTKGGIQIRVAYNNGTIRSQSCTSCRQVVSGGGGEGKGVRALMKTPQYAHRSRMRATKQSTAICLSTVTYTFISALL